MTGFLRRLVLLLLLSGLPVVGGSAELARYAFAGDATDSRGSFDGRSVGSVSFQAEGARDYVALGADGVVAFPEALTAALLGEQSLEVSFDFRLPQVAGNATLFAASVAGPAAIWQEAGVALLTLGSDLIFTLTDGSDPDGYVFTGVFSGLEPGRWYAVNVIVDLELGYWQVGVDDGAAEVRPIQVALDPATYAANVLGTEVSVGGADGLKIPAFEAAVDIDELVILAPAPSQAGPVNDAFLMLRDGVLGDLVLDASALEALVGTLLRFLQFVDFTQVVNNLRAFTDAYEAMNAPLYEDGVNRLFDQLGPFEQALQFSQGVEFEEAYVPGNADALVGRVFEHREVHPGVVAPGTPRVAAGDVTIDATYQVNIAAILNDETFVVRPTGYYAPAGEKVTLRVPERVTEAGLSVVVGVHYRTMDYDYIGAINRFPDVSVEYPLDDTTIEVITPFGGGIYVKVPEGTDDGEFTLTVENAVMAPYFSWRDGKRSDVADWLRVVSETGAPWADFESDKFLFTVPTRVLDGVTNPDAIMARWDEIMDAIRLVAGRPMERSRAEFYTFDTRLVTPAYGAGYPLVIPIRDLSWPGSDWNPLAVLDIPPGPILLHEMGHNHLHPTLGLGDAYDQCGANEAETIVHTLAMSVYANVYGMSIEDAFEASSTAAILSFEEAAFDWIITDNFRNDRPMDFDASAPMPDKDMLKYQPRGWAKYGDIARLFGWEGLSAVNGRFYRPGQAQDGTACPRLPFVVRRDEYIRAASEALGVNMAPLFHFWGIVPSQALREELAALPPSPEIEELIERYRRNVAPKTFADYKAFHDRIYNPDDYQSPRYDEYIQQFDDDFAAAIDGQFERLLREYFYVFRDGFE